MSASSRSGPRRSALPSWAPPAAENAYARFAVPVAIAFIAVSAVRLHELYLPLAGLHPALLVAIVGMPVVFQRTHARAKISAVKDPAMRLLFMYVGWAALTVPLALWRGEALAGLRNLLPAPAFLLAILLCPPTWRSLDRLLIGGILATVIYAFCLLAFGSSYLDRAYIGLSLDQNDIACMFAAWAPVSLGFSLRSTGTPRGLGLAGFGLLVVGIAATGSRGGTIALLGACLTLALSFRGRRLRVILLLLVLGMIGGWVLAPMSYRQRIIDLAQGKQDYNSSDYNGRLAIWGRALRYTISHPLLGVGIANFPTAEGRTLERAGHPGKWSVTHNTYLQASAELGLPGLALLVALMRNGVRRALRLWRPSPRGKPADPRRRPELLSALVGFAIGSVFLSNAYSFTLFALIGVIALADRSQLRDRAVALKDPGPTPRVV